MCRTLSKSSTEATTSAPATVPITTAPKGVATAVPAVMPTSPARAPFKDIEGSGLPNHTQEVVIAETAPADAARVVVTAMAAIERYASPVIRLQLVNAVCRALGARNLFYSLYSLDDLAVSEQLVRSMRTIRRQILQLPLADRNLAADAAKLMEADLVSGAYERLPRGALRVAEMIADGPTHAGAETEMSISAVGHRALRLYMDLNEAGKAERPEVFSIVCLRQIVRDRSQ